MLCDDTYLMLDIALPIEDPRVLADVTESYRWLAEALAAVLPGLVPVPLERVRALDDATRAAGRVACFAGLGPFELVDTDGRKVVGLAQRRRRRGVLLQAAAYLSGDRRPLADMLWLPPGEREELVQRLGHTSVLGARGHDLPDALGPIWE